MRFGLLAIMLCGLVVLSGCILASNPPFNRSKNIALDAISEDSRFHDDNMHTRGETGPILEDEKDEASQMESDKYTEAVLKWRQPQTIQQVVIKAEEGQLEFFAVQYMNEAEEWVTVKEVKDNLRTVYTFTLREPIVTTKFRLKVPRRWDSRRITGAKRSTRGETGAPSAQEYKKIQEIELYYALPLDPVETATADAATAE
ncbi:discoidin domain-containing protein [Candidatus Poribacteria bacterium]|nr:hypothetical protein [Candidatus Poribacteria bacterium]MXY27505.1 discoidin domain-containing protein [Candidatus Poribacteria bacterium]MYK18829.1 discoidin domain-containing protein [Candidatus Poribacteria bacterium]